MSKMSSHPCESLTKAGKPCKSKAVVKTNGKFVCGTHGGPGMTPDCVTCKEPWNVIMGVNADSGECFSCSSKKAMDAWSAELTAAAKEAADTFNDLRKRVADLKAQQAPFNASQAMGIGLMQGTARHLPADLRADAAALMERVKREQQLRPPQQAASQEDPVADPVALAT